MVVTHIDHEQRDDMEEVILLTERPMGFPAHRRRFSSCTVDDFDDLDVADHDEIIDLTADLSGLKFLRQDELPLEKIQTPSGAAREGSFLQVRKFLLGKYNVEFVLVKLVLRCQSTDIIKIRGIPFIKVSAACAKLPRKANEVSQPQFKVSDEVLRNRWRGNTVKGGSWIPSALGHTIDLESGAQENNTRSHGQRYTMFDSCSGAGGVSRGALMAGFRIQYAIDKAPEVWDTYRINFPETELFRMSLDKFLSDSHTSHKRVDVLHFSPPCQFFSPAHTHASEHDDENIFALYGCNQLLKKLRPRIITVEQTFGLTHDRHEEYFNTFLQDFTQHNYSVRWKVVKLCTWGAAQDRKRLIIIAAAPGERLPPFPDSTHGNEAGLKPYTTIGKAIRGIRHGDDLHDLDNVHYFNPPRVAYDAERLAGTITTRGGDIYYPDGSRKLTLREFASLQGFPKSHRFLGNITSIKRQIGNAFPPTTVRVLYKHIEQWLLNEDGMTPCDAPNTIVIEENSVPNLLDASEEETRYSPEIMEIDITERSNRGARIAEEMVIDLT
ncbi:DNA cytosine-5-methyltransferase [Fusarium longipes]|uniref:DNA (cytosine-5-)-methyltransferase n=1 Tax=Fusarium longipes TaxID=694270 RepID=A0A395RRE0_9HYPO|nr:DNA cytosine-5-methyltransferase [Fusarium longipes]